MLDHLKKWLEQQIQSEETLASESRKIEDKLGDPRIVSTGHYQRSVAYQKTLREICRLQDADVEANPGCGALRR